MTTLGRTLGSVVEVFLPSLVSPMIGVISEPEYVVGMATCGRPVRRATALPRPTALPPPTEMSASRFFARSTAGAMISLGLCTLAVSKTSTSATPASDSLSWILRAREVREGEHTMSGFERFRDLSSPASSSRVPGPKKTFGVVMPKTNGGMGSMVCRGN